MTQESSARPVVVGVDGSSAALAAAGFALEEARARSAPLHVVTAVSWPYDGVTALPPQADVAALLRDGGRVIAQAASEALARVAGDVDLRTCVVDGHPVDVLLEMSEGAQLIMLGSRGVGASGACCPDRPSAGSSPAPSARWSSCPTRPTCWYATTARSSWGWRAARTTARSSPTPSPRPPAAAPTWSPCMPGRTPHWSRRCACSARSWTGPRSAPTRSGC